jgi:PAS domain S-box-containing protein
MEEEREAARALFSPHTSPGVRQMQAHVHDRDGVLRAFDIALIPLLKRNELVGFAGSAVDVTERSVAQARLQTQLAFTELMMQSTPVPMSVLDAAGRYVRVNQAWEDFTGFKAADVVGHVVGLYLPPSDRAQARQQVLQILKDGQPQRIEASLLHADGTLHDMLISRVRLPVERGQPAGVLSMMTDVTDLRRAERATREARDAAEEASRAKSEFIANISHELRTPLQSIIGFSELGMVRGRAHERLATMFGDIHASGQRMLKLVNDLLDVSKIESTIGTIHLERADLRGLAREVVHELEPQLMKRGLAVDLDLPDHPVLAKVDPMRMQQVLRNVLANAVKFSPSGVRIRLRADYNTQGEPEMSVHDRGPGIPESELESIFEAFVQSTRTKDGSGGTGLGLAITRKIVQAHGGRIHAENAPEGGAVFHIVLPARGAVETQPMPL